MIEAAAVVAGAEAVKTTEDAVSVVGKVVNKLRVHPDLAALQLSQALNEIMKTYLVVDEAFNSYFSLAEKGALKSRSKDLYAISGGRLTAMVKAGKGDCHKIYLAYQDHLAGWFSRIFDRADMAEMEHAFLGPGGLSDTDETLFYTLGQIAGELEREAQGLIGLVHAGDEKTARKNVKAAYEALAPMRTEMAATVAQMYDLKNDFDEIALGSFRG